eukprot:NODE_5853_length_671_cov_9.480707_g4951_i0.p1 GENE.NODE_5853_length_671_cov_9.480707_g4951_i0~~NODE_5853_length_671_cov_9.480707_g4951_i0.p1  ORF type:complete len:179 (+),score=36.13 NODE_5853_length_671_cov_9.480707_g4951_i0:87-623(+)
MGQIIAKMKRLFSKRRIELCLVGLDNSGKTTLLNVLAMGYPVETLPTVGLNVKMLRKDGVTMKVWDLGGQERFRCEWNRYAQGCNVIIFCVDAADIERLPDAKRELHALLDDQNLHALPLLVCLNKIDLDPHISKEDAIRDLNMDYITENKWLVLPISALKKMNIEAVVDWLIDHSTT